MGSQRFLQHLLHMVGSVTAVANGIAYALSIPIQQDVVYPPSVDAQIGGGSTGIDSRTDTQQDLLPKGIHVPAKLSALCNRRTVWKTVDLFGMQRTVCDPAENMPTARCTDVYGKIIFHDPNSFVRLIYFIIA